MTRATQPSLGEGGAEDRSERTVVVRERGPQATTPAQAGSADR